jgi:hypothetical protein
MELPPPVRRASIRDSDPSMLTDPAGVNPLAQRRLTGLEAAAAILGLQLQLFEIRTASALSGAFKAIDRARVEALLVRPDPNVLEPHRPR